MNHVCTKMKSILLLDIIITLSFYTDKTVRDSHAGLHFQMVDLWLCKTCKYKLLATFAVIQMILWKGLAHCPFLWAIYNPFTVRANPASYWLQYPLLNCSYLCMVKVWGNCSQNLIHKIKLKLLFNIKSACVCACVCVCVRPDPVM